MGVSLHYKGRFNPAMQFEDMASELYDIAKVEGWEYKTLPAAKKPIEECENDMEYFKENIEGIILSCTDSEPFPFIVDMYGRLISFFTLLIDDPQYFEEHNNPEKLDFISTKTQYAGWQTHIKFCNVLKYIGKKYCTNFEVMDEGGYYESGDEEELKKRINFIKLTIDSLSEAFEARSEDGSLKTIEDIKKTIKDVLGPGANFEIKEVNPDEEE
jgi:hypothetical protein